MNKLFALPTLEGKLCEHFGHCDQFALVYTDNCEILNTIYVNPPVHHPGAYPRFLSSKRVDTIIAGGIGTKAKDIFKENNIEVIVGIKADEPTRLVQKYFENQLIADINYCKQ